MNKKPKYDNPEDEEFARTGSFSINLDYKIKITQKDMERKLVEETEGNKLPAEDLKDHNKN